jgi:hypothetical protein
MASTSKYALLMVFDYRGSLAKSSTPRELLGMVKDIERSFYTANNLCGIPRKNITIITDVASIRANTDFPWEAGKGDGEDETDNPTIVRLMFPSINIVSESMLKFINKIHFLERGKNRKVELFSYFSGHGVTFTDPTPGANGKKTSCIILIDSQGTERRYLTKKELVNIFHAKLRPDEMGMVKVPIIQRKQIPKVNSTEYHYYNSDILVNSGASDIPEGEIKLETFFLYDSCQSGSLSGLKYKYLGDNIFEQVFEEEMDIPLSMAVSATNDFQDAPSCSDGSPFTSQMCGLIKQNRLDKEPLTVRKLQRDIQKNLHPLLVRRCTPTISVSVASLSITAPAIGN